MASNQTSGKKKNESGAKTTRSASGSKRIPVQEEKTAAKNQPSRGRDIIMLVIICVAVLAYVAIFANSPEMKWMNDGLDFLFGKLKYVAPLCVLVVSMILLYHEKTSMLLKRLIGFLLFFFALSGLFALKVPENGGLLGRLNALMFGKLLGVAGSVVVNVLFIAIAAVLCINFSVFSYLHEKSDPDSEKNRERLSRMEKRREERQLERENQRLMKEYNRQMTIDDYKKQNHDLQEYNDAREQRMKENAERFKPVYGIGDTTIREDSEDGDTTLFHYGDEDATVKNADLFGKYSNSGTSPETEENDTDFIPEINFGKDLFDDKPEDTAEKDGFSDTEGNAKASSGDKYEKIVITAGGKITRVDTDGTQSADKKKTEDSLKIEEEKEPEKEYKFPPIRLLNKAPGNTLSKADLQKELQDNATKLQQTLKTFGIGVIVTDITCGPSVTRYEFQPEVGVKVSRIVALTDDIKMNLAAKDIRMEAPIPGKSAIGIEVPNRTKTGVYIRDLLESPEFTGSKSKLAFTLGRDIEGNSIVSDIAKMPHVLIAGTTGSGKSVCLNTMIMSIIYHAKPTEVKMIMVDPKMVEMQVYNGLPHLLLPVITDPRKASLALSWACQEMDRRYESFAKYCVRGIEGYNQYVEMEQQDEEGNPLRPMPQIVIFVDEMSDMMMVARKEVEDSIIRLAQKARAAGIHLVLATQSPRAEVLTGLIKANVPSRIALSVSSGLESRIIIDMNGAESLLGHGDMLYLPSGANKPSRIQGAFVSDEEIAKVMEYMKNQKNVKGGGISKDIDLEGTKDSGSAQGGSNAADVDELFEACGRYIIENEKGSIGNLQRKFSIGFNRAARIMDQLHEKGVVGEEEGTKPRRVLMSMVQFNELLRDLDI